MKPVQLVLSCEHAVNTIPHAYQPLFYQNESILTTHRAIDFGAQAIAKHLSQTFNCPLHCASVSRLLIDCNRHLGHPHCFSEFSKPLSAKEKEHLIQVYYHPYRNQIQRWIASSIQQGHQVLHLSIHSFTPVFKGITRNAGIGLLYDPKRHGEKEVAREWHALLQQQIFPFRTRLNYPYKGTSDGFTSTLRQHYLEQDYLGLEIETNQALTTQKKTLNTVLDVLAKSIEQLLELL